MKCIFCEIINGNSPAEIIYENNSVISFLDINPMNYGHTLVIPREHFPEFNQVPENILHELISAVQHVSKAVSTALNCDGYNIVVNNGRAGGQSVFHSHFHIIPRYNSDFRMKLNLKKYPGNSISEYAQKIKNELKSTRRENE